MLLFVSFQHQRSGIIIIKGANTTTDDVDELESIFFFWRVKNIFRTTEIHIFLFRVFLFLSLSDSSEVGTKCSFENNVYLSISSQCNYYVCTRVIIMIIIIIILSPVFLSLSRRRTFFSPPPFRPIVVRRLDALGGAVSSEINGGGDGGFADVGKTWDGVDKRWE